MPLPTDLQNLLRQYDVNEVSWRCRNNQRLLDRIQQWIWTNNQQHYIRSRQFATDMRLFSESMYTTAQLRTYPAPMTWKILKNAVSNIRRRI